MLDRIGSQLRVRARQTWPLVEGQVASRQRKSNRNGLYLFGPKTIAGERTAEPAIDHVESYGIRSLAAPITGGQIARQGLDGFRFNRRDIFTHTRLRRVSFSSQYFKNS